MPYIGRTAMQLADPGTVLVRTAGFHGGAHEPVVRAAVCRDRVLRTQMAVQSHKLVSVRVPVETVHACGPVERVRADDECRGFCWRDWITKCVRHVLSRH